MSHNKKHHWLHSLKITLKNYCKNSTLHGYKYLVQPKRPTIEKCIWSIILLIMIWITCCIFHILLAEFQKNITITTLENTKYHINNVPFPAVAICDVNRISRQKSLEMALEINNKINISTEEIFDLLQNFGKLYDFEVNNFVVSQKLQNIIDQFYFENYGDALINVFRKLSPSCDETIKQCFWLGFEINCSQIFRFRRTTDGFCCTFNYIKAWSNSHINLFNDKLGGLYFTKAGFNSGLTVVLHSNPNDYYYPLISSEGFSVKVFSSHDYPDVSSGALIENFIPLKTEAFMQVSATVIEPVEELRNVPIQKRGCIFENEGKTVFDNSFYSYSDCLTDCRLKSILALCECVPFFLPVLESYTFRKQICNMADIFCLNKFSDKWNNIFPYIDSDDLIFEKENSLYCPNCLPSCFSITYKLDVNLASLFEIPNKNLTESELINYSIIHIYSDSENTLLFKTDINYQWFDVISTFGGACSLFIGFSLISVVEFIYFITIKYYRVYKNQIQYL